MRKLLFALALLVFASCTEKTPEIIKKERINVYEVTDTFGELKKKETPSMVIVRECNQGGNITKLGFYNGESGEVLFGQTFVYNEQGIAVRCSKQATNGIFSITEDIYKEDGRWFKNEDGKTTLLGEDYHIADCVYTDFVQCDENGICIFIMPSVIGGECAGEIIKKDKTGKWIEFSIITQDVGTPQMILERELEMW